MTNGVREMNSGTRAGLSRAGAVGAAVALFLGAGVTIATPASASSCDLYDKINYDSAEIRDYGRSCSYIAVRHGYDPVWSNYNFWTAWYGGYGDWYNTPDTPVLFAVQTIGT